MSAEVEQLVLELTALRLKNRELMDRNAYLSERLGQLDGGVGEPYGCSREVEGGWVCLAEERLALAGRVIEAFRHWEKRGLQGHPVSFYDLLEIWENGPKRISLN